jgi:small subunit ribosomal protein S15
MTTTVETRSTVIKQFQTHPQDTGSPVVQVALLTQRINGLSDHFKAHKKDVHSRRGLLRMVSQRRRLLDYLKRHDESSYRKVLDTLGLRK